jgi:LmbE family N-acetylglucosaminyl deacetylase
MANGPTRCKEFCLSFLIVVSHPDDEVLGAGATIAKLSAMGRKVHCCILSGKVDVRKNRPELTELHKDIARAHEILGIAGVTFGEFPNIRFNTVAHVELVKFIEQCMREVQPRVLFTHHPQDLNDDHRQTAKACQAAARLFQRGTDVPALQGLYYMEVPSATDWAFSDGGAAFRPTSYSEIGEPHLETKLKALAAYRGVMREFPHPRSREVITGLAALRGGQAGMHYAEAFEVAFQNIEAMLT